ncbi:MAG: hypothetical protein M0Z59_06870 [Nitrospiraceae bacterium]|nr:hypothetical protein [Nitrospiraceae bacterium]
MKRVFLIFGLFLLSSCATAAQMRAASIRQNAQAAMVRAKSCLENVMDEPGFQSLAAHMPMDLKGIPTMEQLIDNGVPNDEDTKKLIKLHDEIEPCRQQLVKDYMRIAPSIASILIDEYEKSDLITADLVQHKITWGEANKQRQALKAEITEKVTAAVQEIDRGLAEENAAELANRQRVFNAWMQWQQNQQLINSLNRPVTTNCTQFGNSTNCTSY